MKQVEILLPAALDHGFDYRAEGMELSAGDVVTVPFGRGESLGVVLGEGKAKIAADRIKNVLTRHEEFPAFSEGFREFLRWAAWYNCAPLGMVLKMALPVKDVGKKPRRRKDSGSLPSPAPHVDFHLAELSGVQREAAAGIEEKIGKGFSVTLLDGVTGSGKTEVYFDAIAKALSSQFPVSSSQKDSSTDNWQPATDNSQVLILLPEIALTVQWLERFEKRFGFTPTVWNSEITPAGKREAWKAIATGAARVVIGARSALFLPYKNLSLVIVDEEHDQSYKQEEGVIYHARDMAVARARFEKFPVVLVSATPSLESFYNARQGKYAEVSLPARHGGAALPGIELLDMKKVEVERGAFISNPLREKLKQVVAGGHQAMLFLNRRGYAPLLLCRTCGHRFQCPECSSWLVMHKSRPRLECHHCGYHLPVPDKCPECSHDDLAACGPGVERLHEEVKEFLPGARVAVMASDHTASYSELESTIRAMGDKQIDLLIGTQMIAKGHHFSDLALVGVVDADLGLAGGDLRAAERTYQLLHQLSGRAGREKIEGKVYLQSFLPDHPVMQALLSGDREAFLQAELSARKNAQMPPFTRLAAVIVEGANEAQVIRTAKQLASSTSHETRNTIHVLGPAPAPLYMLRGKYRFRLLVRADRAINLPDYVKGWVAAMDAPSSVRIRIDIDPVSFL